MNSEIYAVKLQKHTKEYKEAKETLKTAFPRREQSPFWALRFLSKHHGVDFLCFYDKSDNYIGVSYSIHDTVQDSQTSDQHNRLMILYLAVAENARSKGYGSKIVTYLQEKDNITETVLDIESPYEQADNQRQRVHRLAFYERLGFRSSNSEIIEPACHYLILGRNTTGHGAVQTYKELTDKLTGSLCKLKIEEITSQVK